MTDNEKLASWQGYKFAYDGALGHVFTKAGKHKAAWMKISKLPDYINDEAAAMSLLDTLVEKGYVPLLALNGTTELWQCCIDKFFMRGGIKLHAPVVADEELGRPTRHEAVVAAVLGLIEREGIAP